ncbi:Ig-like domain-containing protein [Ruminiclostridium josui]|uniref:Ig-like domain-containing protein n=1 Tax=Ruminiclostridium josui TaxID=1499 RepID=UPI000463BB48|nr:Ig-like domain-containing protein [Ruminiclostridium josui]
MRNLRKLTAVVIAVALVLTSMTAAFAASGSYEFEEQATVLKDLGIWQGDTTGDLMLGEDLTRAQGAVLVLKTVLGKTDKDMEAADVSKIASFDDADEVPAWAEGWVALAVQEGVMKGGNNKLAAGDPLKGKDLASMFMNALGFADENNYAKSVELLAAKSAGKILVAIADDITNEDLTRDAASAVVFDTLTVKAKDAAKTVVEVLVGTDAAKKAVAEKAGLIVAPAAQTVTGVKALNLKQVQITFAKDLVKADAEKIANYVVTEGTTDKAAGGSVALQADGKSVIVTLGQAVTNGASAIVEVKNFATYKSDAVKFEDSTVPTVVGVTVSGPNTLTVEYSEPVQLKASATSATPVTDAISNGEFKVDGGNYIVTNIEININKVTLTVGVPLTEGAHKVSFESKGYIFDYAGYNVLPKTVEFTVTNDKTAPVLTLKSAEPKTVILTSNKPLDENSVKSANVRYRHTYNTDTYFVKGNDTKTVDSEEVAKVTLTDAGTTITIDFSGNVIPLGATNLYIGYDDANGTQIQDLWGNKLPATTIPLNIVLDTVKPTVTEVKFDNTKQLTVVFSEKLDKTTAEQSGNYVIKDSTGKVISVTGATLVNDDSLNKVQLAFTDELGGGSYTIEIKGVKDDAFVNNVMDTYTSTLNFTDKVAPKVLDDSARIVVGKDSAGNDSKKASIYIPFSEQMDPTTLVKANFMKNIGDGNFVALGDNDTVTAAADGKSVTIVLDKSASVLIEGDVEIKVGLVKDVAGNTLATYVKDVTPTKDTIKIEKVEAIAKKQIKVTFTGRLSTITAKGFKLTNADDEEIALSVASVTLNNDGKSEVVFNLGAELKEDATYVKSAATATIVLLSVDDAVAVDTKSYLGAVISTSSEVASDLIAPSVNTVKVTTDGTIEVTFNEDIDNTTLAASTLNGFSVSGDVKLVKVARTSSNVITLTPEDGKKFSDSTVVKYNSVAGITDTSSNKVADFEKTATK